MIFGDNRLPQRFWDKVQPEPNTGCWLWTAALNSAGRPWFGIDKKSTHAYYLTTELERGPRPEDKHCSHLCDQKLCVNPKHIIFETLQENNARLRGKPHSDRAYPQYAHLLPAEYRLATNRERHRNRAAAKRRQNAIGF